MMLAARLVLLALLVTGVVPAQVAVAAGSDERAFGLITGAEIVREPAGPVIARFDRNHDSYDLVRQADGSTTIGDGDGGKFSAVRIRGVSALLFRDGWRYEVATGRWQAPTGAAVSPPPPASRAAAAARPAPVLAPVSGGGALGRAASTVRVRAPRVPMPSRPGEVQGFTLQNLTRSVVRSPVVTFGQVFAAGDLRPGTPLVAQIKGGDHPVQLDVKTAHADGSVAHAILSLKAPDLPVGGSVDVMVAKAAAASTAPVLTAADVLSHGYDLKLGITLHHADGTTTPVTIDGAALVRQAIQSGHIDRWLSGPLATQFRVKAGITPNLKALLDIQINADGSTHTDVIMTNALTYTAAKTVTYDIAVTQAGKTLYRNTGLNQYASTTWHHQVDSDGVNSTTDINVIRDVSYLEKTGAIPTIDLTGGVSSTQLAAAATLTSTADFGPLGKGTLHPYMPETGARSDIGLVPEWSGDYLASQDARALKLMLGNADVSGSVPWHFIDDATNDPIRVDQHPNLFIDARNGTGGTEVLPGFDAVNRGGWTPDNNHTPELTYTPYVLTGDRYYLDELQNQAAYHIGATWSVIRDQPDLGETRGIAWLLRDLANAAFATPDGDPLKAYYRHQIDRTIGALVTKYLTQGAARGYGQIEGFIMVDQPVGNLGVIKPWMDAYVATVLGQLHDQGFTAGDPLLAWMNNWISGSVVNLYREAHPGFATPYILYTQDAAGHPLTTWAQISAATFGADGSDPNNNAGIVDPALPCGQFADTRAAVAAEISVTRSPLALQAWEILTGIQARAGALSAIAPYWNLIPRPAGPTMGR